MIEEFLKTYKDGHEVFLNDKERDEIAEEIKRLRGIIEEAEEYIEIIQYNEIYGVKEKDYLTLLDILKGSDKE